MNKTYQELCDELKTANERIAELQAERDLHEAGEKLQLQLRVKANERENALLVHLDRLIEAWDELAVTDAGTEANREAAAKVTDLFCSTPAASVSRLVAEKQAEVLKATADEYRPYGLQATYTAFDVANHLEATAAKLSQQTEGDQHVPGD